MLLDPNTLNTNGSTTSLGSCHRVMEISWVSLSENGVRTARSTFTSGRREEAAGRHSACSVSDGGGSAAWNADGTGIYYTRYPAKGERSDADLHFYQQIYFTSSARRWSRTNMSSEKIFTHRGNRSESSQDGNHLLARVANGDGGITRITSERPRANGKRIARLRTRGSTRSRARSSLHRT